MNNASVRCLAQAGTAGLILCWSVFALFDYSAVGNALAASGTCPAPPADYGKDTITVNVRTAGSYRVWSHLMVPSSSANMYALQVDSSQCFVVGGGSSLSANNWTWVDYADGNRAAPVDLANLAVGSHTFALMGLASGVKVDGILLASDKSCVPTGNGSNCNSASAIVSSSDSASMSVAPSAKEVINGKSKGFNWMGAAIIGAIVLGLVGAGLFYAQRKRLGASRGGDDEA